MTIFDGALFDSAIFDTGAVVVEPAPPSGGGGQWAPWPRFQTPRTETLPDAIALRLAITEEPDALDARIETVPGRRALRNADALTLTL